jgi:hypothetical protein
VKTQTATTPETRTTKYIEELSGKTGEFTREHVYVRFVWDVFPPELPAMARRAEVPVKRNAQLLQGHRLSVHYERHPI